MIELLQKKKENIQNKKNYAYKNIKSKLTVQGG